MNIEWTELSPLPPLTAGVNQPGLAGPFAGIHGNTIIVAGGANFPDSMPWHGGKKQYHSAIFTLDLSVIGGSWQVMQNGITLPRAVAYGASASVSSGVVCMGGETEEGLTGDVYVISVAGSRPVITPLPPLPEPLSNASAVSVGSKVYIAGGTTSIGGSSAMWCLDTEHIAAGWDRLADMPLQLINSVMAANRGENPCLWMLGGRTRGSDDDVSVIRSEVLRYSVEDDRWSITGPMTAGNDTFRLAAGTGMAVDGRYIAIFGGNDGSVFNRVEKILSEMACGGDTLVLAEKKREYISLQESHPGFSRDVIIFDTRTGNCTVAGEIPGPAQVTTTAVRTPAGIVIPGGEIKPGVRTPVMRVARIITDRNK